jgi:hypothetical protein
MSLAVLISAVLSVADQSVPAAAVTAAPVKEKKICRLENPTVGTRIGGSRRVCRTAADWSRREAESQELVRRAQEAGGAQICQNNGGDCGGGVPGTDGAGVGGLGPN